MSRLSTDDVLHISVRPSHAAFRLPINGEETPVLMVAAGTGVAPFRGFIQERAMMLTAGRKLAPALLFLGCRELNKDTIFREELEEWEAQGAVVVRRAYSRKSEDSGGCKYVNDRLWKDRDEVLKMWNDGAKVYVCGSRSVADAVRDIFINIFVDADSESGSRMTEKEARLWFESLRNIRYVLDVFD
ncbi:hypothetical protein O1611_g92 [Lasiodiplodia mahajangana]|uniref:Uncharacterized protein n=1 Tax=Lasiodiplodia mahajangana TaxID=1108764 RepID=A0ACC2K1J5_9PEZI|nr:hypothetical protein O1611_g92 [Lasiodiplodia mahajangana]